ncbi:MAG: cation:proton antiporter [Actinomycetota bacterium]
MPEILVVAAAAAAEPFSRALLFIELGTVILGLALLARLASRLAFSPIPFYLLAGLAFGRGGFVPVVTAEGFIEVGADLGVILLLFMLGLEYSADELTETLRVATRPAVLDLVLNFPPGLAVGLLLGWGIVPAVLLGGITFVTSSGIVSKLVLDLEWVGNRETPAVLSILVVEDLTMAVYLPVVAVLLLGTGIVTGILTTVAAMVTVGLILLVALRFGPVLSRAVFSRSDEAVLLSILGLTLLVAGIAERVQVSAAVGAFLVGIAVSGPAADRARSLLGPMRDLFGAVFFVFFGLRIDPSTIPGVLGPAVGLAAAGVVTKAATGWWATSAAGVGVRGRLRAGALLAARGEFSIAIAALAVGAGREPLLGPLTAAYVLVLAAVTPLLARLSDAVGRAILARRRPVAP